MRSIVRVHTALAVTTSVLVVAAGLVAAPATAGPPAVSIRGFPAEEWTLCGDAIIPTDDVRFDVTVDLAEPASLPWRVTTDPPTGVLSPLGLEGVIDHPGGTATHALDFPVIFDDRYERTQRVTLAVDVPGGETVEGMGRVIDDDRLGTRRSQAETVQEAVNLVTFSFLGAPPPALVVVSDEVFADGLAAAFLGDTMQVTSPDALHPAIRVEGPVTIVGGEAAVSPAVEQELRALHGVTEVTRIGGLDRFDTAARVAAEGLRRIADGDGDAPTEVLLASGDSPVDAAAAAQLAGQGLPLLLTGRDALPGGLTDPLSPLR